MKDKLKEINRLIKYFPGERVDQLWIGTIAQDFIGIYQDLFEELPGYIRYAFLEKFGEFIDRELHMIHNLRNSYSQGLEGIRLALDIETLIRLRKTLTRTASQFFEKSHSVVELHEFCTTYHDRITLRTIELIQQQLLKEERRPSGRFAWIRTGSAGREEQTLVVDQDNLIVYEEPKDKEYFRSFSNRVVNALEKTGFAFCAGGVMASNSKWRWTLEDWKIKLREMAFKEEELVNLIILMDSKVVAGDPTLASQFIQEVHKLPRFNLGLLREITQVAIQMPLALTVFKGFKLEGRGKHKNQFNAKLQGWMPLVLLVLSFALKYGIRDTNTVKRIRALERQRRFDTKFSADLQEAYFTLTRHKVFKQIEALRMHRKPDYYLNPKELGEKERKKVWEALIAIDKLRRIAATSFELVKAIPGA